MRLPIIKPRKRIEYFNPFLAINTIPVSFIRIILNSIFPGDPNARPMTWTSVDGDRLLEPAVSFVSKFFNSLKFIFHYSIKGDEKVTF